MVKQTKKGSIGKKALSAILAASMIMTSSSFVMAGPVVEEVEAVAVEEVNVSGAEEQVKAVAELKGNVDAELKDSTTTLTYNGEAQTPELSIKYTADASEDSSLTKNLVLGTDYTVEYSNNTEASTDTDKAVAKITYIGAYASLNARDEKEGENKVSFDIEKLSLASAKVDLGPTQTVIYNGKSNFPEIQGVTVTLADGKVIEVPATDYEVIRGNNTNDIVNANETTDKHGKVQAKADSKNFTGATGDFSFRIDKAVANKDMLKLSTPTVVYTPGIQQNAVASKIKVTDIVKENNEDLRSGDYTVEYFKDGVWGKTADLSIGTHEYRIKTTANCQNYKADGILESTYTISKGETLAMYDVEINGVEPVDGTVSFEYDKDTDWCVDADKNGYVDVSLEKAGIPLTEGRDFKVDTAVSEWKNAGEYSVTLTGIGAFEGDKLTIPVKITPAKLNASATTSANGISVDVSYGTTHSNKPSSVSVVVKDGDQVLKEGTDYTFTTTIDEKNKKATVVLSGVGNYTTELSDAVKTYTITETQSSKLSLADASISAELIGTVAYEGKKIYLDTSNFNVVENDPAGAYTLTNKDFYVYDYKINNTSKNAIESAGEYIVTLKATANGKYEDSVDVVVNVAGLSFEDAFKLDTSAWKPATFNDGQTATNIPSVVVLYKSNNGTLQPAKYDVNYYFNGKEIERKDITQIGTYTVEVTPDLAQLPSYTGKLTATFEVVGKAFADVEIKDIADQQYTGEEIKPSVIVEKNGTLLVEGKDYTVSYDNNIKVGTAYVIITGIGNYSGRLTKAFNIVGEMDQPIEVLPAQEKALQSRTLNDKATKVKYTTAPETSVTYKSSDEDVVTVDAEGNIKYTGLGEATITIEAAAENGYKAATKELKVVVGLKQPTFSPSSKNNAFTVTTSTVKGAEKFQVQYVPTGKSFTSKAAKSKTFTVDNKLKKGKISAANKETYRIRVRAINGDTKSKWSPVKTIATK